VLPEYPAGFFGQVTDGGRAHDRLGANIVVATRPVLDEERRDG
jgi:hypothetical protein